MKLYACGSNDYGELGLGDTDNHYTFTEVPLTEGVVSISGGTGWHIILKNDGTLWGCGYNNKGQLGLGDSSFRNVLTQIGVDTDWAMVACGEDHTLAVKTNGTLWGWGENGYHQLGTGINTIDHNSPIQIGSDTNWLKVAAGYYSSMGIKTDGTLWGWGRNSSAELGLGDASIRSTPTQIGSDSTWIDIDIYNFSMCLKADGTLWSSGKNNFGQLGVGDTLTKVTHQQVLSGVASVSCGDTYTIAIKQNGTMWVCGQNDYGNLGFGDLSIGPNVFTQSGTDSDWDIVSCGQYYMHHVIGVKTTGFIYSWGDNSYGKLGLGNTTDKSSPTKIGESSVWYVPYANPTSSFALVGTSRVFWTNFRGQSEAIA